MTFDRPWREPATTIPETRYTRSGEVHIAYQALGSGSHTLKGIPEDWQLLAATAA